MTMDSDVTDSQVSDAVNTENSNDDGPMELIIEFDDRFDSAIDEVDFCQLIDWLDKQSVDNGLSKPGGMESNTSLVEAIGEK